MKKVSFAALTFMTAVSNANAGLAPISPSDDTGELSKETVQEITTCMSDLARTRDYDGLYKLAGALGGEPKKWAIDEASDNFGKCAEKAGLNPNVASVRLRYDERVGILSGNAAEIVKFNEGLHNLQDAWTRNPKDGGPANQAFSTYARRIDACAGKAVGGLDLSAEKKRALSLAGTREQYPVVLDVATKLGNGLVDKCRKDHQGDETRLRRSTANTPQGAFFERRLHLIQTKAYDRAAARIKRVLIGGNTPAPL